MVVAKILLPFTLCEYRISSNTNKSGLLWSIIRECVGGSLTLKKTFSHFAILYSVQLELNNGEFGAPHMVAVVTVQCDNKLFILSVRF